jgi:hypothetical protein
MCVHVAKSGFSAGLMLVIPVPFLLCQNLLLPRSVYKGGRFLISFLHGMDKWKYFANL